MLENIANNKSNYLGVDLFGNQVYSQMQSNGSQIWVYVRNGVIQNGGMNVGDAIRIWVEGKGLILP